VTVTNFELWHLGLLAYVFQDFADGLVPIGFGKSKGFGQVRGAVESVTLSYLAGRGEGKVQHLGSLCSDEERRAYGFHSWDPPAGGLRGPEAGGLGLYESYAVADLPAFWKAAAAALADFLARQPEAPGA
jgi:hypothetical protein